jgi:two-component system response regulator NreC
MNPLDGQSTFSLSLSLSLSLWHARLYPAFVRQNFSGTMCERGASMKIRLVLVDDEVLFVNLMITLLRRRAGIEVVGHAHTGHEAIRVATRLMPHVVLMDIGLGDLSGIDAAREIRRQAPSVQILALTVRGDPSHILDMVKAGAKGYLDKNCSMHELLHAIREVRKGRTWFPQRVSEVLAGYLSGKQEACSWTPPAALSPREQSVLQLLADGQKPKEIAASSHLSVFTVHTYRRRMMEKLGLRTDGELIRYAIDAGLGSASRSPRD